MTQPPDEPSTHHDAPDVVVGPPAGKSWKDLTDDEIAVMAATAAAAFKQKLAE